MSETEVRSTLARALADADRSPADVVTLVVGMAGLNSDDDQQWAEEHTLLDGITAARTHVNDSVIAHVGAFLGEPGVLVVAGTGSIILGIDREGRHYRNDHVHHYAGGARHLSYDVVHHMLIGDGPDDELVSVALEHWQVTDLRALRDAIEAPYESEAVKRAFGTFAPEVTKRSSSSTLAQAAIQQLAARTAVGVRLVSAPTDDGTIAWSGAGSVAHDPAFIAALERELARSSRPFRYTRASLTPLGGAALMALQSAEWFFDSSLETLTLSFGS